jgi:EAL domain-containing protein (putative c-di-GMP-specific phosphodiesterase class I)
MLANLSRIVDFDLCAIIVFVVVLITLLFRKVLKTGADRYLLSIVFIGLLTTIFDFIAELFEAIPENSKPEFYILRVFVCYAYFSLRNLHAPIYLLYIVKTSETWHMLASKKGPVILGILPFIVATVTLFSNIFTHQIFAISEELVYSRGSGLNIIYCCNGIYMAMGVSTLVSYRKLFRRDKFVALLAMYPLNMAAVIVQLLMPKYLVEMLAVSLACLFIVMTLRDEEGMRDPILGIMNYRSFNNDTRRILFVQKPVNMILINIVNWKSIYQILGNENSIVLLRRLKAKFEEIFRKHHFDHTLYYLELGYFAVVDDKATPENIQAAAEAVDEYILEDTVINQIFVELNSTICCVKCPTDFDKYPDFIKFVEDFRKYVTDTKGVANVSDIIANKEFLLKNELPEIIANAIMNKSFTMYYQPIYSSKKKTFVAAEAFVRLKTEKYGYIPPALFIKEAETSGAIHQLWDILIDNVCRFVSKNELRVIGFEHIDINISEIQFMETDFSEKLERALRKYRVHPSMLAFELKETAIMNDQPAFLRNIKRLEALGIHFSLDDYGTGTSNMCRISQMPISVVKMDREFINKTASESSSNILKNTVSLINEAGMKTLAEGIEDEKTAELLMSMGCDYLQGYYYSKPLSEQDFMEKFHSYNADELF